MDLPHSFLDYLLTEQYPFEGTLTLLLRTPFDEQYYCCMNEFTRGVDTVDIPESLNQYLNLTDDIPFIHVSPVQIGTPSSVVLQGHKDSIGNLTDIKERLEDLFADIKVLNKGMTLTVTGPDGQEQLDVVDIIGADGSMIAGLVLNCDIEIDFLETRESIRRAEAAAAREAAQKAEEARLEEARVQGQILGGTTYNRPLTREERLAKIEAAMKRASR